MEQGKKYDVTALGELLIDFTQNGLSEQGNFLMEANPGGAPCNVLAMLNKLGRKTAFLGKVGNDFLGRHLRDAVEKEGIDVGGLCFDDAVHTTLAFVHTDETGDRDFSFYRNPGADMCLRADEVDEERIAAAKLFHFGTLSMTHEGVREATLKALACAKENGCLISFDPNLREPLWDDLSEAKKQVGVGMSYCDVLKISDNEIQWFTGEEDYTAGVRKIQAAYDIPLILVSMGAEGSRAYCGETMVEVPPVLTDATIETTGAGDTFCACVLHFVLAHGGVKDFSKEELAEMLSFANAAASLVTTKKGALRVMPTPEEVEAHMQAQAR